MNKYELAVVFSPVLEDDERKAEFDMVCGLITKFGGTVERVDDWGKRRLAYEIKKLSEGVYNFIGFTAPATTPIEVESRIRLRENVLRYLIIRENE